MFYIIKKNSISETAGLMFQMAKKQLVEPHQLTPKTDDKYSKW